MLLKLFYDMNKIAMNFYWLLYLKYWFGGEIGTFGHIMGWISIMYLVSNIMYFRGK